MIGAKIQDAMSSQIVAEFYSAYMYLSMLLISRSLTFPDSQTG